ncbi:MAG: nitrous oxide reductase accessory protein NosL [SAR324 cluster bacterium]|nr:nitrous oxide reductase accessory protein NosL [SAR324 cluster bacterium]
MKNQPLPLFCMVFIFITLALSVFAHENNESPRTIDTTKECPLCGMIPARYPLFHCQIVFMDGSYEAFDSAIGLLVYLFFPEKTERSSKTVQSIYFKDYIAETWIEAKETIFVVGSEVLGPMGVEFLPVNSEETAQKLSQLEKGKEIIRFERIDRNYLIRAAKKEWLHVLASDLVLH